MFGHHRIVATTADLLRHNDIVLNFDNRVVAGIQPMLPVGLAETMIHFIGGTEERVCNSKSLLIKRRVEEEKEVND